MKLILETETNKYYYFKGMNLIIVQRYDGVEHVYSYAEAVRRGIVQKDVSGNRIVVGTNWYYNFPEETVYRRF